MIFYTALGVAKNINEVNFSNFMHESLCFREEPKEEARKSFPKVSFVVELVTGRNKGTVVRTKLRSLCDTGINEVALGSEIVVGWHSGKKNGLPRQYNGLYYVNLGDVYPYKRSGGMKFRENIMK